MANAADGDFAVHRRFILKVALEVGDREEDENFTAAGEAGGAGGKKVDETTAIGGAAGGEEVGRATTADGETVGGGQYLTKAFSTATAIITSSS